ncbi:MAG TPA: hypothetical protein VNQ31_07000 [Sphingomonadaceae bacterium]|nr:hypothetical protein [Sphingomonadaceae bacterium]
MQFLRTLFWVVVAVVAVVFSYNNWKVVHLNLWGGLVADVNLPLLIFGAFLLGLLPPYILHRATRWSLRRRIETAERALAEARAGEEAALAARLAPSPPAADLAPPPAS